MTREEFKVILAGLMSNFKGFKIIEPEHFAFWYEALKDIDYQVCQLGVLKLVQTLRFPPTIADIRAACTPDSSVTAADAWSQVVDAIKHCGYYREREALDGMDPMTRKTVESMGYKNLCISENNMADRAHFLKMYEQMATRERTDKLIPEGLNEQIKRLTDGIGKMPNILQFPKIKEG